MLHLNHFLFHSMCLYLIYVFCNLIYLCHLQQIQMQGHFCNIFVLLSLVFDLMCGRSLHCPRLSTFLCQLVDYMLLHIRQLQLLQLPMFLMFLMVLYLKKLKIDFFLFSQCLLVFLLLFIFSMSAGISAKLILFTPLLFIFYLYLYVKLCCISICSI